MRTELKTRPLFWRDGKKKITMRVSVHNTDRTGNPSSYNDAVQKKKRTFLNRIFCQFLKKIPPVFLSDFVMYLLVYSILFLLLYGQNKKKPKWRGPLNPFPDHAAVRLLNQSLLYDIYMRRFTSNSYEIKKKNEIVWNVFDSTQSSVRFISRMYNIFTYSGFVCV